MFDTENCEAQVGSASERPILRVKFLSPEGILEQSTLSSTWSAPGISELSMGRLRSSEAIVLASGLRQRIIDFYEPFGCEVLSMEAINTSLWADIC